MKTSSIYEQGRAESFTVAPSGVSGGSLLRTFGHGSSQMQDLLQDCPRPRQAFYLANGLTLALLQSRLHQASQVSHLSTVILSNHRWEMGEEDLEVFGKLLACEDAFKEVNVHCLLGGVFSILLRGYLKGMEKEPPAS